MWFFFFSVIDWNNPAIINKMYKVYLGDIPLKTKEVRFAFRIAYLLDFRMCDFSCLTLVGEDIYVS